MIISRTVTLFFSLYGVYLASAAATNFDGVGGLRHKRAAAAGDSFLQREPLFMGQIVGGRVTGDLSKDVTDWNEITDCDFYAEQPGRCIPTDVFSPCVYCKAGAMRFFGSATCPGDESFPPQLQSDYEWRVKPHMTKGKGKEWYLCVVQPRLAPAQYVPISMMSGQAVLMTPTALALTTALIFIFN